VVTIRHYQDHWALQGRENTRNLWDGDVAPDPRLPRAAQRFWRQVHFPPRCNGGVVARDHSEIIGICRYEIVSDAPRCRGQVILEMAGTWIARQYRRDGLATRMWRLIFRKLPKDTKVHCVVATWSGARFVTRLAQQYPHLHFQVSHGY